MTATPYRKDGLTTSMYWALGYKVYEVVTDTLMDQGQVIRPDVTFVQTDFNYFYDDDYPVMVTALTGNAGRNELINEKLLSEASAGHFCMVLSERVDHCYEIEIERKYIEIAKQRFETAVIGVNFAL